VGAKRPFSRKQEKKITDKYSNLLILADSGKKNNYKEWNAEVDRTTNKGWAPTAKETGYPAAIGGPVDCDIDPSSNLSFPPNLCVYCGDTDVPKGKQSRGLFIFNNAYPEIGIKLHTRALHYMCFPCAEECVFPTLPAGLALPDRIYKDARAEWSVRAELHMVGYLKTQRQAGVEGNILGDEERRRRLSDD
jgi:hypothetical protein